MVRATACLLVLLFLTGRVLQVNGNHFEIFGEKVFLSGLRGTTDHHQYNIFGLNGYQSETHECFLWNLSQSGGNYNVVYMHDGGSVTPMFNSTGHVVGLDREESFINDVIKYLRAAAHYDIVVKDEPGFGGFSVISRGDHFIKVENNTEPCFDTLQLKENAERVLPIKNFLRHIEAIRSVDPSIPITILTQNWTETSSNYNYFADECFQKANGSSQAYRYLSFHTYSRIHMSRLPGPLKMDTSHFNEDKPYVLDHLSLPNLSHKYQYAYSHGFSGAWTIIGDKNHQAEAFSGVQSLKSEVNPSMGGLVNFTLTKYEICRRNRTQCVEKN